MAFAGLRGAGFLLFWSSWPIDFGLLGLLNLCGLRNFEFTPRFFSSSRRLAGRWRAKCALRSCFLYLGGVAPFPPGCLPAVLPVAFGGPTSPGLDSIAPGRSPPGFEAPNIINPGFAFRPRGKSGCAPVRTNSLSRPIAFHCPPPWMATPLLAPRSFFSPPGRSKARYAHGL